MMEEITLTGATMADEENQNQNTNRAGGGGGGGLVEMTTAHSHTHSHGHSHHENSCCTSPTTQELNPMNMIPSKQAIGVLLEQPAKELFQALSAVVRMSAFVVFEAIFEELQEKSDLKDQVLNMTGIDGHTLVHWASKRVDDISFLKLLVQHVSKETLNTASKDDVGMHCLHWACTEGSIPHVALLLKSGANIEACDFSGCTPLLISAQYGHVSIVAYLMQHGADIMAKDTSNDTALHWAAYKGSLEVCGLLSFYKKLSWNATDSFGQTPLHLASLRGNTSVVRYILQQMSRSGRRELLYLTDNNHKTPLDLAVSKKRPTVEAVLRAAMEELEPNSRKSILKKVQANAREFFSVHSWRLWMGCVTNQDEADESPKFPLYYVMATMTIAIMFYPLVFLPVLNTAAGLLWDHMGWHAFTISCYVLLWWTLYKTYTTNPGTLDDENPRTGELRRLYEETLESYSDEQRRNDTPLCHTCHVARPLRSKHCRVARRCVLLFDHHCPFVGATVGLYNYKWFYLFLLFLTFTLIGYIVTLGIYLSRLHSIPWATLLIGIYVSFNIIPAAGMLIYHTQLTLVNLTTNEHQNLRRYKYLQNERGQYSNPFFRGVLGNFVDRFAPSEASYTLRRSADHEHHSLLQSQNAHSGDSIV